MHRALVAALFAALVVTGCGKGAGTSRGRVVGAIRDADFPDATPVWLGAYDDGLYVGLSAHNGTWSLLHVDAATGKLDRVAHDLPPGAFAPTAGRIYVLDYVGKVGVIDRATGAYHAIVDLGESARSIAVVPGGVLAGVNHRVLLVADGAAPREVAGSQVGDSADAIDAIAATRAGVFASSSTAGTILKIDGDHATVIADHQTRPEGVVAAGGSLAWIAGDHIVAMPVAGGKPAPIADVGSGDLFHALAADGDRLIYSVSSGVYAIAPSGGAPTQLASGDSTQLAAGGGHVYWTSKAADGWTIATAP